MVDGPFSGWERNSNHRQRRSPRVNQDRLSAERQLDRISVEGKACNLIDRVTIGIETVRKSKLDRREVYVLSDMRKNSWSSAAQADLLPLITGTSADQEPSQQAATAEKFPRVLLQIIDLGVPQQEIRNWSLENLRISAESVVPGGSVTLQADLKALEGETKEQLMVELAAEPLEKDDRSARWSMVYPRDQTLGSPSRPVQRPGFGELADSLEGFIRGDQPCGFAVSQT